MIDEYTSTKIKEALAATDGNKLDAQKLLITWAVRDPQLLLGMTKPHLKAIAAGLIDHASREGTAGPKSGSGPDKFSRTAIDDIVASATTKISSDKRKKSNLPPPKTTERQASAMRTLAEAYSKKKK